MITKEIHLKVASVKHNPSRMGDSHHNYTVCVALLMV